MSALREVLNVHGCQVTMDPQDLVKQKWEDPGTKAKALRYNRCANTKGVMMMINISDIQ